MIQTCKYVLKTMCKAESIQHGLSDAPSSDCIRNHILCYAYKFKDYMYSKRFKAERIRSTSHDCVSHETIVSNELTKVRTIIPSLICLTRQFHECVKSITTSWTAMWPYSRLYSLRSLKPSNEGIMVCRSNRHTNHYSFVNSYVGLTYKPLFLRSTVSDCVKSITASKATLRSNSWLYSLRIHETIVSNKLTKE